MVEYVKLEKKKPTTLTDAQRTRLILFTYLFNFNLYILLFNLYESFILKWFTFIIINSFSFGMLSQKVSIGSYNGWAIIYAIINGLAFGFTSMLFSFNLLVIIVNLLYFKYIVKHIK